MEIRTYQRKDQNQAISLWKECGLVMPQNDPVKDIERKMQVDPDLFLVGVSESIIVATVMGGYEGHRGWINYLAVGLNHRRHGYGKAMMVAVEVLLKKKGCPKINLQVRSTKKEVIDFYDSIGYGDDNVVGLGKRLVNDNIKK